MEYLKEDGSLDIERINGLSLKELNAVRLGSYVLAEQFSI